MIRQALRSLLRARAFSITVVLTVALGIGVNTAIFSVIYSVLLDPLPYRDPERLVHVAETHPEFPSFQVAAPDYFDWRRMSRSFEDIAAHTFQAMNQTTLLGHGEPERIQAVNASYQLFPMLGIQPLLGRTFSAEEEAKQAPVILLSEALWRRKFSADPSIAGRTIRLGNSPFTVVGVIPKRQAYPTWTDVWIPLSLLEPQLKDIRRFHALEVVARLKPGVSLEHARSEMQAIAGALAKAYPDTNNTIGAAVLPLSLSITREIRPALLIAWAAVSLVLLLACANVSHLVMIRSVARSREMAIRSALGASRLQLMRAALTENVALALAGGALGVVMAEFTLPVLGKLAASDVPRLDSLALTPIVLWCSGAAAILCGILFAVPAMFGARKLSAIRRRSLFGATIVAAEIALAFVVITGAGLLYRSVAALLKEDAGFDARRVLAVEVPLARNWDQSASLFEQRLAPRIREIPGVTSVAAANCAPMALGSTELSRFATRFGVPGRTFEAGKFPVAQLRWITPDYFSTLRIPLTRGRPFTAADAGKPGYIVNETLARRFFPGQDPVGKRLLLGVVTPNPQAVPIIGVVGDVRDLSLDIEPRPTLYSFAVSPVMTLLIAADASPASLIPAVRGAIRSADAEAPITRAAPLSTILESSVAKRRFALYLLSAFAALAAALTAIGVYGVIAYSVSRREREFAIRFALGAQRSDLRSLILRNFALPTSAGLIAGAWFAYLFAQTMRTQLYKLAPSDPAVLGTTILALTLLVAGSALRPAAKAASVSATALRE